MIILSAGMSGIENVLQLLVLVLIFLFVLAITYFTTKWIARYQKNQSFQKNLKVIETIRIANSRYVQIVEAGNEYLVIAVGKDEVQLLTKLTKEQLTVSPEDISGQDGKPVGESFQGILEKMKEHLPKNRQKNE